MAKYIFQLMSGGHVQDGKFYRHDDPHGNLVESDRPLDKLFVNKFRRVSKQEAALIRDGLAEDAKLGGMTVAELKAYAEAEEIDLGDATKKEDLLRTIRESLTGVQ